MSFKLPSLVVILLAALEIAPISSARLFLTGTNYPSGEYPVAAAVQDFNNDGFADIATANQNDKNVSVFLGNRDGTFGTANTFSVGAGAIEIASADLNKDGNADLVVTDGIHSTYIVLGNGDGTFGSPSTIRLHNDPIGITIADLNGDAILDLAIAIFGPFNNSQGEVAVLIGIGDGSFGPPVFYDLTHNGVRLVATDLNHDGKLDLAVAVQHFSTSRNGLAVLLGNGDGTFQPVVTSVAGSASDVAAADFNGDGNVDLALTGGEIRVVLGNGDGTFQPAISYSSGATTVATADLNRDGVPDLLVGGYNTGILLGKGDGTFGSPVLYGVGERFARIGYFNSDRDPDVVAGGGFSEIGVAFGRGAGTLRAPRAYAVGANGFDSADFDGDGHADVVVSGAGLSFLRGLGDGTFAAAVPVADLGAHFLIATDLNGDGKLDLLITPFNSSEADIHTLIGNGDGTFQAAQFTALSVNEPWPAVADYNKDGQVDVALTGVSDDKLVILIGKGDGTFEPEFSYQTGDAPQSPTAADFNGDGNLDLAVSNVGDGTVGIYLGQGNGTFAPPLPIRTRNPIYSAAADFNQDGKVDFVVGGDGLNFFLGNGDGTFQSPQTIYSNYGPVKVADLDRDGRVDIAVSVGDVGGLVVLRGRGDGTFGEGAEFPIGSQFSGYFALSDLNGDAKPEAIASNINNSLIVLLNTIRPRR